ncbi:MAG: hypothetical protein AB8D78_09325 [Akkermansiaceae bacterium]
MPDRSFGKPSPNRPQRETGDAPLIGKVSRTPQSAAAESHGSERGHRPKKATHSVIKAWSVLFAFLAFAVLVAFSVYAIKKQKSGGAQSRNNDWLSKNTVLLSPSSAASAPSDTIAEEFGEKEALDLVTKAHGDIEPSDFENFFILSENQTPEEAAKKLQTLDSSEGPIIKTEWLGSKFTNNQIIYEVVIFRKNDGSLTNRLAQIIHYQENNWRIDFDSLMRTSSHGWDKITLGDVTTAEVRVFIATDNYYNGIFADEKTWQAFVLVSPDSPEVLYGYVQRDSAQHKALIRILSADGNLYRATLEIQSLPESAKRQFKIARVLSESWFVTDEAYDESF